MAGRREVGELLGAGAAGAPEPAAGPVPATATSPAGPERPGRPHLVVVTTRPVRPGDDVPEGATLITRFWHPRDRRWSENAFATLEHALRLFVDESGWVLRQQQELDDSAAHELIFEARREDFTQASTAEVLEDVGLTPGDVAEMIERIDGGDTPR